MLQLVGSFHQGGSERQAISLARMLSEEGSFDVSIATLNAGGVLRGEAETIGVGEICEFPLTSFYNANFVRQVRRFARYLSENRIDLIHTHDFYTNVFGMAAATLARVPVRIASKRETGEMRSGAQGIVEKVAFSRAHAIVANSAAVQHYLVERGVAERKVKVIYNGVDLSRFDHKVVTRTGVCERLGLPGEKGVQFVTLVANLRHAVKNVPMLLRAAKRVVATRPNAHFVIAGEGELANELKLLAEHMKIGRNVHFIGRCDDVAELLSISDIGVLTSTAEGFSNSILEYMAAGKPVVATNVGGAAESVIDGETGYLVEANDDAKLTEHLTALLSDTKLARKMGIAGRQQVEGKFDSSKQLSATVGLYTKHLATQDIYGHTAEFSKMEMGADKSAALASQPAGINK